MLNLILNSKYEEYSVFFLVMKLKDDRHQIFKILIDKLGGNTLYINTEISFLIHVKSTWIRLYLQFSNQFGTKQIYIRYAPNLCEDGKYNLVSVHFTRTRKDFFVWICIYIYLYIMYRCILYLCVERRSMSWTNVVVKCLLISGTPIAFLWTSTKCLCAYHIYIYLHFYIMYIYIYIHAPSFEHIEYYMVIPLLGIEIYYYVLIFIMICYVYNPNRIIF